MVENSIAIQHHQTFTLIRKTDDSGNEYWLARQLVLTAEQKRVKMAKNKRGIRCEETRNSLLNDAFF